MEAKNKAAPGGHRDAAILEAPNKSNYGQNDKKSPCAECGATKPRHLLNCTITHVIPHEQCVLGSLLLDENVWLDIKALVVSKDFHNHAHRQIFSAIVHLADAGKSTNALDVAEFLDAHDCLEAAGGIEYLVKLAWETSTSATAAGHAVIVTTLARERRIRAVAARLAAGGDIEAGLRDLLEVA